jgi:hypothetical protein
MGLITAIGDIMPRTTIISAIIATTGITTKSITTRTKSIIITRIMTTMIRAAALKVLYFDGSDLLAHPFLNAAINSLASYSPSLRRTTR